MEPVLTQEDPIYYVSDRTIIEFISKNAPMEWNECCKFVMNHDIVNGHGATTYWDREELKLLPDSYNNEQLYWIQAFFDTHTWINRMMIVFDD